MSALIARLAAAMTAACPDCPPIRAARAAALDDPGFWLHLLGAVSPFLILALTAGALHRVGAPPPREDRSACP